MKFKIKKLFLGIPLTRRGFLKYMSIMTGLLTFGRGIKGSGSEAIAQSSSLVVSVHNSNATNWDYATGSFWQYVDQETVNSMVAQGVMRLTGTTNTEAAWKALIPYQAGEAVAIKFNFNNTWNCTTAGSSIDAIPETANAIIDGLRSIGVPGNKIWITDPSRRVPDRFRNGIINQDVQYYSFSPCSSGGSNYHAVPYVDPDSKEASIATCPAGEKIRPSQVLVDADHLINVPILKSHGAYVTLALKNHYGSVIFEHYNLSTMHQFFNEGGNAAGCELNTENILADINNNPNIRDKTRLIIGDGLFGNPLNTSEAPKRWEIFGNDSPNMLFFSTDPIAVSSVMTDYIVAERGNQDHQQLHAGEHIHLGVHDHWDSFETKRYSSINYINIGNGNTPSTPRNKVDVKIRQFKENDATEQEVKQEIDNYMEGD